MGKYAFKSQHVLEQQKGQGSSRRPQKISWAAHKAWLEQKDWFVPSEMKGPGDAEKVCWDLHLSPTQLQQDAYPQALTAKPPHHKGSLCGAFLGNSGPKIPSGCCSVGPGDKFL